MIGQEMGLSADERDKLNWGALFHDIGKIALPSAVLNKKGPLTTAELDLVASTPVPAPLPSARSPNGWGRGPRR